MLTTPTLSIMASLQYLVLIRLSVIPEKSLPIKYQNGQAHHMIKNESNIISFNQRYCVSKDFLC